MKQIPLTRGQSALIDDEDFERISRYRWHAQLSKHGWYATATIRSSATDHRTTTLSMHRLILNAPEGVEVDHRNHQGLDNRRSNLRLASRTQNQHNSRMPTTNTSGYKGVCHYSGRLGRTGEWKAQIGLDNQRIYLGKFKTPEDAARAYDRKAIELYGEFAHTNFPREEYQ